MNKLFLIAFFILPGSTTMAYALPVNPTLKVVATRLITNKPTLPTMGASLKNRANMVLNARIKSVLRNGLRTQPITGRVSASLRVTPNQLKQSVVEVNAFNIFYNAVNPELITGIKSTKLGASGYGFSLNGSRQLLKYDPVKGVLSGKLQGQVDMSEFLKLSGIKMNTKNDDFQTPTQPAQIFVSIQLDTPFNSNTGKNIVEKITGKFNFSMVANKTPDLPLSVYKIETKTLPLIFEISWLPFFEIAKNLCIQPVRIGRIKFSWPFLFQILYSGDGLNFGMPGANTQWAKADVTFKVRNWITVWKSQYSTFSSSEAASLLSEVDVADCVEVFFTDRFSPSATYGGGATWSGGSASTKIISSDENADNGIDLTHLAHELGHALTLKHPGSGFPNPGTPNRIDASSGTLLCPSGFMNDNPAINSQWNKDSISNPLLTFSLKIISAGPDCTNNADCGACP